MIRTWQQLPTLVEQSLADFEAQRLGQKEA
jgi:hypothetical protein